MIRLRDYQVDMISRVRESLHKNKRVILQAPTGCHGYGHPILMHDGSVKEVQDIDVGDLIMGPDSCPRLVLDLHRGVQNMVQVTPTKGDVFYVNEDHIFNLYVTPESKGKEPRYENVTAKKLIEGTKWFRHIRKLHRTSVDFEKKTLPIDPWFLGVLLGDGFLASSTVSLTTGNEDVIRRAISCANDLGVKATFVKTKRRVSEINFSKFKRNSFIQNNLTLILMDLGLHGSKSGDKFIPKPFLTSDRSDRLELLAGLLDTDGSLCRSGYDYISKSEKLIDDILFLCRSLGLAAYKTKTTKSCQGGFTGVYYRAYISGDCSVIPCITHKKSPPRKQIKNVLVTGFSLEEIGPDKYYGFTVDKDSLYVDGSFTVHHNSGKTAVACHMMAEARAKGMRSVFMVHQNELLNQTSKSLWKNKIEHGLIASGKAKTPLPVQLASVMTLKNRISSYDEPDLIIIDEAHRALAPTYQEILKQWPNAYVVGLTATPQRTDGKGLDHIFKDIVLGPSIQFLMDQGYLCDYELYGVPQLADTFNIKTKAGDYDAKQAEQELNRPRITGDAVDHYRKLANGRPMVVMCTTVKHADDVALAYNQSGIAAKALHGGIKNRDDILKEFESGKFNVLTSVNLMIEGVDLPFLSAVQWLRPTQSIVVYMQGNGRGLRPHSNKDNLVILDHVGNWQRHGMPCENREWLLAGRKKRSRGKQENLSVQTCQECYFTFRSGVHTCPHCGAPVEFKKREIETIDGELKRIKEAAAKKERRQEQGRARTIEELVELGIRRELKNPAYWAATVYASRQKRRPTPSELKQAYQHAKGMK